jgi:hypothetical protein
MSMGGLNSVSGGMAGVETTRHTWGGVGWWELIVADLVTRLTNEMAEVKANPWHTISQPLQALGSCTNAHSTADEMEH